MIRSMVFASLILILVVTLFSCASIPGNLVAVQPFDKDKYLGRWYEIARMDFRFEKNLKNVTATYSLNDNGTIRVDNRGYDIISNKWKKALGKAKLVSKNGEAMLKVSFFGPFYSGYNVIAIDNDYTYALVAGKDLSLMWILSREKTIPDDVKKSYLEIAGKAGYKIDDLVWTVQDF